MTTNASPAPAAFLPLNAQQRNAAAEELGPVLILGGPGTGKTHTLIARIKRLLESGAAPQTITYVTFGARIADDVRRQAGELTAAPDLFIGTLHHYASFFLRQAGAKILGFSPFYSIWDHQQAAAAVADLGRESQEPNLKWAAREIDNFLHWKGFNQAHCEQPPKPPPTEAWHAMLTLYAQEKFAQNALDLDDIIPYAVFALESNPELQKVWSSIRTRHLLVDEFQDITPTQYKLLRLMTGPEHSIAVATDPNQSIYMWRGADPSLLQRFRLDYPRHREHLLTVNHRSTRTLTELSRRLSEFTEAQGVYDSQLQALRPEGPRPKIIYYDGSNRQMDRDLTAEMRRLHEEEQVPWHEMALIFRRHATGSRLRAQLYRDNIPNILLSETLDPQEDDAQHLLSLLTLLTNPDDLQALSAAAVYEEGDLRRRLPQAVCQQLLAHAEANNCDLLQAGQEVRQLHPAHSKTALRFHYLFNALRRLRAALELPETDLKALIQLAWNNLHGQRRPGSLPPAPPPNVVRLTINAEANPRLPDETLEEQLARFLESARYALLPEHRAGDNADPLESDQGAVLSTIHAAKGLQWPCVWVVDAADHIMPGAIDPDSPYRQSRLEEEQRLFYVAATRATDRLAFCCSAAPKDKANPAIPSRFIEPIEESADYLRVADQDLVPAETAPESMTPTPAAAGSSL